LKVDEPVPLDVEVVADPVGFLDSVVIFARERGAQRWAAHPLVLEPPGKTKVEVLSSPASPPDHDTSLEIYLVARDARGNEVLEWGSPAHPRELQLRYQAPPPWYAHWWVPVIGAALAGGVAASVYLLTRPQPATVDAQLNIQR
jgi:hypothetical protein